MQWIAACCAAGDYSDEPDPNALQTLAWLDQHCESAPWQAEQWSALLNQDSIQAWLVRHKMQALSYLCFQIAADQMALLRIGVHPAYRRKGLGRWLLAQLDQYARRCGCVQITLEVRVSNQCARSLYQQAGYRQVGLRAAYYPQQTLQESPSLEHEIQNKARCSGREDAIVMACALY